MRFAGPALSLLALFLYTGSLQSQVGATTDILTGTITDETGAPLGGGGGSTRRMDAQEIARRRARADLTIYLAQYGSEDLDVRITPGAVRFLTHGMLDTLALKTDGAKEKTRIPQDGDDVPITTSASWSEGWLVVSREVDGGGKITETYLRSSDGQHLYVVVQLDLPRFGRAQEENGKSRTIEFRRVYDPVTGG